MNTWIILLLSIFSTSTCTSPKCRVVNKGQTLRQLAPNIPTIYSERGIRDLTIEAESLDETYNIRANFLPPYNPQNNILAYFLTIYKFDNLTHVNSELFIENKFIANDSTTFLVEGLQYDITYYLQIVIFYDNETTNLAYAGVKHFHHRKMGKLYASDNYMFGPRFKSAIETKNDDGTYNITTTWKQVTGGKYENNIEMFVITIKNVKSDEYDLSIIENAHRLRHTFTFVPTNNEYQISIYAIAKSNQETLEEWSTSKIFIRLNN